MKRKEFEELGNKLNKILKSWGLNCVRGKVEEDAVELGSGVNGELIENVFEEFGNNLNKILRSYGINGVRGKNGKMCG